EDIASWQRRQKPCRALDDLKVRLLRVFGQYSHVLLPGLPPGCARVVTGRPLLAPRFPLLAPGFSLLAGRSWKLGAGSRKLGAGSWELGAGSWKLETYV